MDSTNDKTAEISVSAAEQARRKYTQQDWEDLGSALMEVVGKIGLSRSLFMINEGLEAVGMQTVVRTQETIETMPENPTPEMIATAESLQRQSQMFTDGTTLISLAARILMPVDIAPPQAPLVMLATSPINA